MKDINIYFDKSTNGEILSTIVADVIRGGLAGKELELVVDELEKKGLLNSNIVIDEVERSEWNESYLDELRFKIHLYSREYFVYLEKVAKYVNDQKELHKKSVLKFKTIICGIAAVFVLFLVLIIRSCSK